MDKPLISFVLIAYNQEKFIREAVEGAFSQTYSPLEIVISDDCSSDMTFRIITEMLEAYRGPHRIVSNRNARNLGIAGNINRSLDLASGDYFIMAAGDDISVPNRTDRLVEAFTGGDHIPDLVCSFFEEIDVAGIPTGFVKKEVLFLPDTTLPVHKWRCGATGACAAYSRKLHTKYGPLNKETISEDWVFPFRAWLDGGCRLVEEPLVKHRRHDESLSVMHKNVSQEKLALTRCKLRKSAVGNELARARGWLDAFSKSGKELDLKTLGEFERWIDLVELERKAWESGFFTAFILALKSLCYKSGTRRGVRIFLRRVLHIS